MRVTIIVKNVDLVAVMLFVAELVLQSDLMHADHNFLGDELELIKRLLMRLFHEDCNVIGIITMIMMIIAAKRINAQDVVLLKGHKWHKDQEHKIALLKKPLMRHLHEGFNEN
jgi:hypothetical protein